MLQLGRPNSDMYKKFGCCCFLCSRKSYSLESKSKKTLSKFCYLYEFQFFFFFFFFFFVFFVVDTFNEGFSISSAEIPFFSIADKLNHVDVYEKEMFISYLILKKHAVLYSTVSKSLLSGPQRILNPLVENKRLRDRGDSSAKTTHW